MSPGSNGNSVNATIARYQPSRLWAQGYQEGGDTLTTLPDSAVLLVPLRITFTSIDLATTINTTSLVGPLEVVAANVEGITVEDYQLRVVSDEDVLDLIPRILEEEEEEVGGPLDFLEGECSNERAFTAYFVNDNVVLLKQLEQVFKASNAGEGGEGPAP